MEKSFCGFINLLIFAFKLRVSKCPVVKKKKDEKLTEHLEYSENRTKLFMTTSPVAPLTL